MVESFWNDRCGKGVAESDVMKGGDYIKGKEGMGIIGEVMTTLQFKAFQESETFQLYVNFLSMDDIEQDLNSVRDQI